MTTSAAQGSGRWRVGVRGTVTSTTESLLEDLHVVVTDVVTVLETGPLAPDTCARTLSLLQSVGLEVVDLHWVPSGAHRTGLGG